MTETCPLAQAQSRLPELVSRAQHEHEPVLLTDHGAPVAAIAAVADLEEYRWVSGDKQVGPPYPL